MFVRNFSRGHQAREARSNEVEHAVLVANPLVTGEEPIRRSLFDETRPEAETDPVPRQKIVPSSNSRNECHDSLFNLIFIEAFQS